MQNLKYTQQPKIQGEASRIRSSKTLEEQNEVSRGPVNRVVSGGGRRFLVVAEAKVAAKRDSSPVERTVRSSVLSRTRRVHPLLVPKTAIQNYRRWLAWGRAGSVLECKGNCVSSDSRKLGGTKRTMCVRKSDFNPSSAPSCRTHRLGIPFFKVT